MERSCRLGIWVVALLASCLVGGARATAAPIIYDNGPSDGTGAIASDPGRGQQVADDFVLQPGSHVITDIHWTGIYPPGLDPSAPDDFTIRIFADSGGVPATVPLYDLAIGDPGHSFVGGILHEYAYWVDIAPIALTPGVPYWLSIVNDTGAGFDWFWSFSNGSVGNVHTRDDDAAAWMSQSRAVAFSLTGVPEPGTALMLGSSLTGLAFYARRHRKPSAAREALLRR